MIAGIVVGAMVALAGYVFSRPSPRPPSSEFTAQLGHVYRIVGYGLMVVGAITIALALLLEIT